MEDVNVLDVIQQLIERRETLHAEIEAIDAQLAGVRSVLAAPVAAKPRKSAGARTAKPWQQRYLTGSATAQAALRVLQDAPRAMTVPEVRKAMGEGPSTVNLHLAAMALRGEVLRRRTIHDGHLGAVGFLYAVRESQFDGESREDDAHQPAQSFAVVS